ncbi:hypothetical protein L1987_55733 [Smallanthus sonchifolius]|uniref:Uncharacterized protein n=1 Tax=Smallanthus sonchifolius TaxID=185202 RepID=A0ACB9EAE4_9ASTR|nr:hypothetical protein L1987_55733 [Smallanthus sonchifolius]
MTNDRIFCAMGSKLMTAEQSTFMIDLHQVGMMLRHATSRSLCLLDEFGKGTLTEDGIGLLGGTIDHFISMYAPPKVLICTHLTQIFVDSHLSQSDKVKYYTMSVLRPENNSEDLEEIVFLYRLVPGHTLLSYGLHCALLAGVPQETIRRAAFILDATSKGIHIDRACDEKITAQDEQYKDAVEKMVAFDAINGDFPCSFKICFLVNLDCRTSQIISGRLVRFIQLFKSVSSLELARLPYMSRDKLLPQVVYINQIGKSICLAAEIAIPFYPLSVLSSSSSMTAAEASSLDRVIAYKFLTEKDPIAFTLVPAIGRWRIWIH